MLPIFKIPVVWLAPISKTTLGPEELNTEERMEPPDTEPVPLVILPQLIAPDVDIVPVPADKLEQVIEPFGQLIEPLVVYMFPDAVDMFPVPVE